MPTVRLDRSGLFGPVGVVDTAESRRFSIGGVLQGASLLDPPAAVVDQKIPNGPGPVIETRYQLAWFMAGQQYPEGRGLMLGLGGGCGAVGLLYQFPKLVLDVVDVDPTVVEMAREFFPLVHHYEQQGRLFLHLAEAQDYLDQGGLAYGFVIVDLVVDSGPRLELLNSLQLIQGIRSASQQIWFRMFGSFTDGELQPVLDKFTEVGAPVGWLFSPVSFSVELPKMRDWILVSGALPLNTMYTFVPYEGMTGAVVIKVQQAYAKLASKALQF